MKNLRSTTTRGHVPLSHRKGGLIVLVFVLPEALPLRLYKYTSSTLHEIGHLVRQCFTLPLDESSRTMAIRCTTGKAMAVLLASSFHCEYHCQPATASPEGNATTTTGLPSLASVAAHHPGRGARGHRPLPRAPPRAPVHQPERAPTSPLAASPEGNATTTTALPSPASVVVHRPGHGARGHRHLPRTPPRALAHQPNALPPACRRRPPKVTPRLPPAYRAQLLLLCIVCPFGTSSYIRC
jgi:hypothetical protein